MVRSLAAISLYTQGVKETGDSSPIINEGKVSRVTLTCSFSQLSATLICNSKDIKKDQARFLTENCRLQNKIRELERRLAELEEAHLFNLTVNQSVKRAKETNQKVKTESNVASANRQCND